MAEGLAYADAGEAAWWLERTVSSGPGRERTTGRVAGLWALRDPLGAGNWVKGLPAGNERRRALAEILDVWRYRDRPTAELWADRLPDGDLREQAFAVLETWAD